MTVNEIIAKALGWKFVETSDEEYEGIKLFAPDGNEVCVEDCVDTAEEWFNLKWEDGLSVLPDCENDLNAIHSAEGALTEEERVWYIGELNKILIRDGAPWADLWAIRHAMAAQCAQALAKVLSQRSDK